MGIRISLMNNNNKVLYKINVPFSVSGGKLNQKDPHNPG